jgi:hypothetical protein
VEFETHVQHQMRRVQLCLLILHLHAPYIRMMACHARSSTPSRASLTPKGKRSSKKVLSSSGSNRNPTSAQSNGSLMRSTRLVFVLVQFVTVLLVNTSMLGMLTVPSNFFHPCRKMFSSNGSFFLPTLVTASANERSEKRLNTFVVNNLAKAGSAPSFHVTPRLSLANHQVSIRNRHRHSIVQLSHIILISLRQSSRSTASLQRISTTWMRRVSSVVVVERFRLGNMSFPVASAKNTNFVVPILSLSQLRNVLQQMEDAFLLVLSLRANNSMNKHGLRWIPRFRAFYILATVISKLTPL